MRFQIIPLQSLLGFCRELRRKRSLKYFNKLKICNFICYTFLKQKHVRRVTKTSTTSFKNWYFCFCSAVCDIHALNINWIYLSPFISDHCFAFSSWARWCCKRNYKWLNAYWPQIVERVLFFYLVTIVQNNVWRE